MRQYAGNIIALEPGHYITLGIFAFTVVSGFVAWLIRQVIIKPIRELEERLDDYAELKREHMLMFKAWEQEALDAIRLLNNPNPHPKRMHDLLTKFTSSIEGGPMMTAAETNELIRLLKVAMANKELQPGERSWASKAVRFVEARSGLNVFGRAN